MYLVVDASHHGYCGRFLGWQETIRWTTECTPHVLGLAGDYWWTVMWTAHNMGDVVWTPHHGSLGDV